MLFICKFICKLLAFKEVKNFILQFSKIWLSLIAEKYIRFYENYFQSKIHFFNRASFDQMLLVFKQINIFPVRRKS